MEVAEVVDTLQVFRPKPKNIFRKEPYLKKNFETDLLYCYCQSLLLLGEIGDKHPYDTASLMMLGKMSAVNTYYYFSQKTPPPRPCCL